MDQQTSLNRNNTINDKDLLEIPAKIKKDVARTSKKKISIAVIFLLVAMYLIFGNSVKVFFARLNDISVNRSMQSSDEENTDSENTNVEMDMIDSDNDGLPDKIEKVLGMDPGNSNTDKDGYDDLAEIKNGYDPLIPSPNDKLTEDSRKKIKQKILAENSEFFGRNFEMSYMLVYEAVLNDILPDKREDAMKGAEAVMAQKMENFPNMEFYVARKGEIQLVIALKGMINVGEIKNAIAGMPALDFREEMTTDDIREMLKARGEEVTDKNINERVGNSYKSTGLSGKQLKNARAGFNTNTGKSEVHIEFNDEGAKLLSEITARNVGRRLAVYLDDSAITEPVVNEQINDGQAVISGNYEAEEANILVGRLNGGALPIPIKLISAITIKNNNMKKSFSAEEAKRIGEALGIKWDKFNVEQFRMGLDVELEHGTVSPDTNVTDDNEMMTGKIALAHLNEFPDYYTRLEKMEKEAEEFFKK